jgi:hypothetical protein
VRPLLLVLPLVLMACSNKQVPTVVNPLAQPPWEAFVQAGPGAEKDLDFETLDGPGATAPPFDALANVANPGESPAVAAENIDPAPAKQQSKHGPNATVIKSVAVVPVTGGDARANAELTLAMRQALIAAGWPIIDAPNTESIVVSGKVAVSQASKTVQKVDLVWLVTAPKGKPLGNIKQSNDVAAGSLQNGWGDNAKYATQAAADGIFKLIEQYR